MTLPGPGKPGQGVQLRMLRHPSVVAARRRGLDVAHHSRMAQREGDVR